MATKLNVSQRAYSKLENNEIKLDWERLTDISKVLEIDPIELISFDDSLVWFSTIAANPVNSMASTIIFLKN